MKKLSIFIIILLWADVIFTSFFISKFGLDVEANGFGRFLFENPILLFVFKIISSGLIVALTKSKYKVARTGLIIIFVSYLAVNIYHIFCLNTVLQILN